MLAKFKTSLVEGLAAIEKRQQRQAIAAARAERAVQREEARQRQERELAKQAEANCVMHDTHCEAQQKVESRRSATRGRDECTWRNNHLQILLRNRSDTKSPFAFSLGSGELSEMAAKIETAEHQSAGATAGSDDELAKQSPASLEDFPGASHQSRPALHNLLLRITHHLDYEHSERSVIDHRLRANR